MDLFLEEKKLHKKGFKIIACLDEAGRGPLAGPVVACAVTTFSKKDFLNRSFFDSIKDSKKLTKRKREEIYQTLISSSRIRWAVSRVGEKTIDKINILEATKLAMQRAVAKLQKALGKKKIDFLIIDGNFKINTHLFQKPIVRADEKVFSCIAASIIAKVTRDRIMDNYHKKYPLYKFNTHKGYPTKLHCYLLRKYGPCKIHRKSFSPVKELIKSH